MFSFILYLLSIFFEVLSCCFEDIRMGKCGFFFFRVYGRWEIEVSRIVIVMVVKEVSGEKFSFWVLG